MTKDRESLRSTVKSLGNLFGWIGRCTSEMYDSLWPLNVCVHLCVCVSVKKRHNISRIKLRMKKKKDPHARIKREPHCAMA